MKLKQLSLFLENKPGALTTPCRLLAEAGINLLTLSVADTQQFGILRIVVRDWEKAKEVLERNGCIVRVTEVVAIEVPDRPGGLSAILEVLEKTRINVEYMYAFTLKKEDKVCSCSGSTIPTPPSTRSSPIRSTWSRRWNFSGASRSSWRQRRRHRCGQDLRTSLPRDRRAPRASRCLTLHLHHNSHRHGIRSGCRCWV